jgi:NAD(P)H-hydrate epimerase
VILALLAQGYSPKESAVLGVFHHGLAGDKAALKKGQTAMLASDIIEELF